MAKKAKFTRKNGKKDKRVKLRVGNMEVEMAIKDIKPKPKKVLLEEAKERKLAHRKINATRIAASLTARKMKPCK